MIKSFISSSLVTMLFLISVSVNAQDLPAPSPSATVKQRVGLTDVEITYSRPGVKDRVIFGDLVPYNELWRTGANKVSAISFSTDVTIMNNKLPAGTYAIFTIPGESEWTFIFNSNTEQWGTYAHKDEEDVFKVRINPESSEPTESMMFYFDDIRDESATINLQWATTRISIPFTVEVKEDAIKNIDAAIAEAQGTFRVYNNSARYYVDNNLDAAKALEWAKKSVSMEKKFWNLTTLARAQAANKMYKDAIKTAEEAKAMAVEEKNKAYTDQNTKNIETWSKLK